MESHGREENFKDAQPFDQDQSVRASKRREVWTMVYGGSNRVPSQEVSNTELMEPPFGRTIDRGLRTRLHTSLLECSYFGFLLLAFSPLKQRRLSFIIRDKASKHKPLTYDASHSSGKYMYI